MSATAASVISKATLTSSESLQRRAEQEARDLRQLAAAELLEPRSRR
jgi:hypothetical protein